MSDKYRKPFEELSDRQKRRRINQMVESTLQTIESEIEDNAPCQNIDSNTQNNVTDELDLNEIIDLQGKIDSYDNTTECTDDLIMDYENFLARNNIDELLEKDVENIEFGVSSSEDEDSESEHDVNVSHDDTVRYRLASWAVDDKISNDSVNRLLKILREDAKLFYLPKTYTSLKGTPRKTIVKECFPGEYFHYGLETAITNKISNINRPVPSCIQIDINIDGLPITKSPPCSLWPILGKFVNMDYNKPFVIGIYCGKEKPQSVNEFLDEFITEYCHLHENGFTFQNKIVKVSIRCLICDAPATCYVLNIIGFNGYGGCRKCIVNSDPYGKKVVFLQEDYDLRTNDSFRRKDHAIHHKGTSPFETIKDFDMIKNVPLDYMHLVCLGVTRKLILCWISRKANPPLNILQLEDLSKKFMACSQWIPNDFARKPQILLEIGRWKATTLRLFLLYIGPIILQKILPKPYMEHFNNLNCAMRILCSRSTVEKIDYAQNLLIYFVKQHRKLYGEQFSTWNIHSLIHLADDVKIYGPLDNFSSFPFENFMQELKRLLRKKGKALQQIHRRLCEDVKYGRDDWVKENLIYPQFHRLLNIEMKGFEDFHRILKFSNFELRDNRPNNLCVTKDNKIVSIEYICRRKDDQEIVLIGKHFNKLEDIPSYPCSSKKMGIYRVSNLSPTLIIPHHEVLNKAFKINHDDRTYVLTLL